MKNIEARKERELKEKIEKAIERIRFFEPPEGYYLAFSGWKDSICCYHLLKMADVKFDGHYSITTVDPPELVKFIREEYPDISRERPKLSMWQLIPKKKMPPTRLIRYCCEALKEGGGNGRFVVTGVRWAESLKRKTKRKEVEFDTYGSNSKKAKEAREIFLNSDNDEKRRMLETCTIKGKHVLNPIIDWSDEDVWEFIRSNGLKYPSLYDKGYTRLGCIACPMSGQKMMKKELERYPAFRKAYIRAFEQMLEERKKAGLKTQWQSGEEVMQWWIGEDKIMNTIDLSFGVFEEILEE